MDGPPNNEGPDWRLALVGRVRCEPVDDRGLRGLTGRDRVEAIALVKLLEEQGNQLRRPRSGVLGDGLFELRGKQVRIFYMFLPRRVIVLLAGEIKKRDAIPAKTLALVRGCQQEVLRRQGKRG